jgi:dipeptidyl aminopeptidase/acylaminoacyl peptidase
VIAITGEQDENTGPGLARDYVAALRRRGVRARFIMVPGAAHGYGGLASAVAEAVLAKAAN